MYSSEKKKKKHLCWMWGRGICSGCNEAPNTKLPLRLILILQPFVFVFIAI